MPRKAAVQDVLVHNANYTQILAALLERNATKAASIVLRAEKARQTGKLFFFPMSAAIVDQIAEAVKSVEGESNA